MSWVLLKLACLTALSGALSSGCGRENSTRGQVAASYDNQTGKLRRLAINSERDGKPNINSYMDGSKVVRIEIDTNEDGKVDRWEHYGEDQKLAKIGLSRADDGREDAWAFSGADGGIDRLQISTKRDGTANRTEFYEGGVLMRAEEDTNGDGRPDKWETHAGGAITRAAFDTNADGQPDHSIDYAK